MPGDRQYMTGPLVISGAIALHIATKLAPISTAGLPATTWLASWTATCGVDWSSWKTRWRGRPWMPPFSFAHFSTSCSACCSALPRKDAPPVSDRMTLRSYDSAAAAGDGPINELAQNNDSATADLAITPLVIETLPGNSFGAAPGKLI